MKNYGQLLNNIPYNIKQEIRNYECSTKKEINLKWSICFLKHCIKENIKPSHIKISVIVENPIQYKNV